MTHHIVLGGGAAALSAIEAIREGDGGQSSISLISDEPAYQRTMLPAWLANRITKQQVLAADDAYFAKLKVDRYIGAPATRINARAKTVTIKGGQTLPFDDLLIATGSSPVTPPIAGTDVPGVQPLWTLAHVEALLQAAGGIPQPEVVLLGGGWIGLIVLNALHQRGWKLHVVEPAAHVGADLVDVDAAHLIQEGLRAMGVGLHCSATVLEIKAAGPRKQVVLTKGTSLDADFVVLAMGRKPNLGIARAAAIATDRGILVNERMQTSVPQIYAAGDVAQGPDLDGNRPALHATQAVAIEQGRVAGANMAGQDACYAASLKSREQITDLIMRFEDANDVRA